METREIQSILKQFNKQELSIVILKMQILYSGAAFGGTEMGHQMATWDNRSLPFLLITSRTKSQSGIGMSEIRTSSFV